MTKRISKNLIMGKPFTQASFQQAFSKGGQSAYGERFLGLKPVAVWAGQQWVRLVRFLDGGIVFETNLIHEHEFESYEELIDFLSEHGDMLNGISDNTALKFHVKGSAMGKPALVRVNAVRMALSVQKSGIHV